MTRSGCQVNACLNYRLQNSDTFATPGGNIYSDIYVQNPKHPQQPIYKYLYISPCVSKISLGHVFKKKRKNQRDNIWLKYMFVYIYISFFFFFFYGVHNLSNVQISFRGRLFDTWRFNALYIYFLRAQAVAYNIYYVILLYIATVCGFVFVDYARTTNHLFYPSKLNSDLLAIPTAIRFTEYRNTVSFSYIIDVLYYNIGETLFCTVDLEV